MSANRDGSSTAQNASREAQCLLHSWSSALRKVGGTDIAMFGNATSAATHRNAADIRVWALQHGGLHNVDKISSVSPNLEFDMLLCIGTKLKLQVVKADALTNAGVPPRKRGKTVVHCLYHIASHDNAILC